jgi:hypothetical protein
MRQIVLQHDRQSSPINTIDLNNPPKKPYTFQKFPHMIYKAGETQKIVRSEQELELAIEAGWSTAPVEGADLEEVQDTPLDAATQAHIAKLDKQARQKKEK